MKPVIVALDVETDKEAIQLARALAGTVDLFKVGPVLFMKYGPPLIQKLRETGAQIFLDMKFHDIPSVVQKAIERAAELGVFSATLHTSGGMEMMRQAAALKKRPKLWGVTILTSLAHHDLQRLGFMKNLTNQVTDMAKQAKDAGLDGVVASALEASEIRQHLGQDFEIITPGIRLSGAKGVRDDQKRTQNPAEALKYANFIVMGRDVIAAKDPLKVVQDIYQSIEVTQ